MLNCPYFSVSTKNGRHEEIYETAAAEKEGYSFSLTALKRYRAWKDLSGLVLCVCGYMCYSESCGASISFFGKVRTCSIKQAAVKAVPSASSEHAFSLFGNRLVSVQT